MTPFIQLDGHVPTEVLTDYQLACRVLRELPEASAAYPATARPARSRSSMKAGEDSEYLWSCHGLARALADILSLDWQTYDGWFGGTGNCHSWLYLDASPEGARREHRFILDAYPIAALGGPLLIDIGYYGSPWDRFYQEAQRNYDRVAQAQFEAEGQDALRAWRSVMAEQ